MDVAFGIIVVIIFLLIALGPILRRWLAPLFQRWMLGKMEDNMRRMAGMPTRKEEKKARRQARNRQRQGAESFRNAAAGARGGARAGGFRQGRGAISYLQVFAEDVEFTEIKEFSSAADTPQSAGTKPNYKPEEQVEDAEYWEIKN